MNKKQLVLLQVVMEQMEDNLKDNLNSYVEDRMYDSASECLMGLSFVGEILDSANFEEVPEEITDLGLNGIRYVANELLGSKRKKDVDYATEFIEECSMGVGAEGSEFTSEDIEALIEELKSI